MTKPYVCYCPSCVAIRCKVCSCCLERVDKWYEDMDGQKWDMCSLCALLEGRPVTVPGHDFPGNSE